MRSSSRIALSLCLATCLQMSPLLGQDAATESPEKAAGQTAEKNSQKAEQASKESGDPADEKPTLAESEKVDVTEAEATEEIEATPEPKATLVPDGDADYDLMGEFVGEVTVDGNASQLGIQIRPIGGGLFEAVQFAGGLPGAGAEPNEALELIGKRFGKSLVLSGGPWVIYASPESCKILNEEGPVGTLERVTRGSPTMGANPPEGATVLFDGSGTEQFTAARMTAAGLLAEGADVKPMFQDFNLHVEFRLPYMPTMEGQKRGNSGCYLQSRYEVQVLDSFATLPVFNGCSSIYRFKPADVNMCLPPLLWQTYDIIFTAPRWASDGSKVRNARLTVWQNGVKTQDDVELPNKTGAGKPEEPTLLPTRFQNHSDPVRFRNIWIVDRGLVPLAQFPVMPEAASDAVAASASAETN